jgi:hypothetical protein
MVAGDVAGVAVLGLARRVDEALPDAWPGAVGQRRAFDLVGRGRRAPQEAVGKSRHHWSLFVAAFIDRLLF